MPAKKPEGYPFLSIANDFGVDYSTVLKVADELTRNGASDWGHFPPGVEPYVMVRLAAAVDEQRAVRDGRIDWQTGEPPVCGLCGQPRDECYLACTETYN